MAINLIRNSRVFFTTNVDDRGRVRAGAYKNSNTNPFTVTNTWEIQVLEGMTFSQNTTTDTVTLSEAGDTPQRGQRSFNTALEPLDFSFATYLRPYNDGGTVTAEEKLLWNAFAGAVPVGSAGAAWTNGSGGAAGSLVMTNSNKHQLQAFGLIVVFDDVSYVLDNCALDTATIDFGLDAIASVQWAGKGTLIRQVDVAADKASPVVLSGTDIATDVGDTGAATAKNPLAKYIANKLSTLQINDAINDFTGSDYTIALTGGSITLSNNLTYLTPANLGVVNLPITYFTGTRAISGNITAYLKTGTTNTAGLLQGLLDNAPNEINPSYAINIQMGGGANTTRVDIKLPAAMLTIPTVNTEQVVSTTINFTAQGYTTDAFDISQANEAVIEYRAA